MASNPTDPHPDPVPPADRPDPLSPEDALPPTEPVEVPHLSALPAADPADPSQEPQLAATMPDSDNAAVPGAEPVFFDEPAPPAEPPLTETEPVPLSELGVSPTPPGDSPAGTGSAPFFPEAEPVSGAAESSQPVPPAEPVFFDEPVASAPPAEPLLTETEPVPLAEIPPTADLLTGTGRVPFFPEAEPVSGAAESSQPVPPAEPVFFDEPTVPAAEPVDLPPDDAESVMPVAPAPGWLDSFEMSKHALGLGEGAGPLPEPPASAPEVVGEAPAPAIEGSDIFGGAAVPTADVADPSDVLAATAYAELADPVPPARPPGERPSDVALTFDQPPGGSTVEEPANSDDLPLAEEFGLPEVGDLTHDPDSLFDVSGLDDLPLPAPAGPAAADEKPGAGELPDDEPDYGASPRLTPEASSILADLSEPGDTGHTGDSSAVRLDVPGIERTHSSYPGEVAEFNLEIDERPVPQELEEAAAAANEPTAWLDQPVGDLWAEAPAAGPSSAPPAEDDEAAVEFSDHPQAESEAVASRIFSEPPATPASSATGPESATIAWDALTPQEAGPEELPHEPFDQSEPVSLDDDESVLTAAVEPAAKTEDSSDSLSIPEAAFAGAAVRRPGREPAADEDKTSPTPRKPSPARAGLADAPTAPRPPAGRPRSAARGWIGGMVLGTVVGAGAFAAAYFTEVLPKGGPPAGPTAAAPSPANPPPDAVAPPVAGPPPAPQARPTPADLAAALRAGDLARARELARIAATDPAPTVRAAAAETVLFALAQEAARADRPLDPDHPDLRAVREHLRSLMNDPAAAADPEAEKAAVVAALRLAVSLELTGDRAAARQLYTEAKARFPRHAPVFDASLERLEATAPADAPAPPAGTTHRLPPADAHQLLLAVVLLQADAAAQPEEAEAGFFFWKAVNKAAAGQFADALPLLQQAKTAHQKQVRIGVGLNPKSDPFEQIFLRCCDELKVYWELRAALYSHKSVAEAFKNPPEKAVKQLAEAQARAAMAVTLMAELTDAKTKLDKAVTDLKKAETDLDDAKKLIARLEKEVKSATDDAAFYAKKFETEEKARKEAETARKEADAVVAQLARELQSGRLLGEKYDTAELLAAQKRAIERSGGPNLGALLSPGMMAAGSGLSGAQLLDIAQRLSRAEAAARAAADQLAAETKRLTAEHAAQLRKLTESHEAAIARLQTMQAAERKKLAEAYTADARKLVDAYEGKLKELRAQVAQERERAAAAAEQFKRDLGNALTPAQALDLWLPLLTELRRPSDAAPALVAAQKVLAAAPADSEDAAKAHTIAGLALLLQNDLSAARAMLETARSSPAFAPARQADKPWAVAAETGLRSVGDPLAPYRQKPELPPRDPALAARRLDAGIKAYRAGRYAEAVAALTEATRADPTSPVAWYFLGAARWGTGDREGAVADFRQGAIREKASDMPVRQLDAALSPIQGPARDALTLARP